jgi:hypothetical protein
MTKLLVAKASAGVIALLCAAYAGERYGEMMVHPIVTIFAEDVPGDFWYNYAFQYDKESHNLLIIGTDRNGVVGFIYPSGAPPNGMGLTPDEYVKSIIEYGKPDPFMWRSFGYSK